MNFRSIFSYLGLMLLILAMLMLLPIAVSWIFAEDVYLPFLLGSIVSFITGIVLYKKLQ
jgi:Trk-type K+ transport system membrane component